MSPGGSGGGGGSLADLTVNFVLKGKEALQQGIAQVQQAIGAFAGAVGQMGQQAASAFGQIVTKTKDVIEQADKLGEKFKKAGDAISIALGAGVALIGNFVRQGLAAGAMGQLFSFQMEQLARVISGLFRPELLKLSELLNNVTTWIRNLTDAQKQSIAYWIEGAAAALAVGVILPRIVAGVRAVIAAVLALGEAIAAAEAATGIGAILPLIGLLVQGMTLLVVGTEAGRNALGQVWEAVKQIGKAFADIWKNSGMAEFFEAAGRAFGIVLGTITKIISSIAGLIGKMTSGLNFGALFETGLKTVVMLAEAIGWVVNKVVELIGAVWQGAGMNQLVGEFVHLWQEAITTLQLVTFEVVQFVREFWKLAGLDSVLGAVVAGVIAVGKAVVTVIATMLKAVSWVLGGIRSILDPLGKFESMFNAPATKKPPGNRHEDARRTGGFEDLQSAYQRIAVAALRASAKAKDPQQRMVEEQERANRTLDQIRNNTGNPRPLLGT